MNIDSLCVLIGIEMIKSMEKFTRVVSRGSNI